ncbi:cytoplasmic protein [Neobacillus mesonae]|uniref:cytoplasmic protein n=1 Tax=Neobacillus mesonae TaxID=1193713 RepID=UPI002040C7E7|nr:cytoplasmic protein [Neobacillus mesonae]MCM3569909.1 cytoplasmic protein [Neobacillus mesonae]
MEKNGNLAINGTGSYPGGHYNKISIRGEGTIINEVECSAFHVYGTSEAMKHVKTGFIKIFGEAEFKDKVESDETLVMGTMAVRNRAYLKKMKIMGLLETDGPLTGETAIIKGSIAVKGNVEYETFDSSGGFEIRGLLTAENIKVALGFGQSSAEEIGGGKIIVKRKKNTLFPFGKETGTLSAKLIEGDQIYLENTTAEIVRGNMVNIGPGCQIGLVEYVNELSLHPSSTIKTKTKG